jgi:predicted anti-sigma-YlaC factor YlaD
MNSHLDEKQITEALLGSAEEAERRHLEECEQCRAQVEAESALFSRFGQVARGEAQRGDDFWRRQRLVISSRIDQKAQHRTLRMVWSAAAAAAAVLVVWVVMGQIPSRPAPPPTAHPEDEVLLMQVTAALERGSPEAFAPAEVLTRELNRRTNKKANRPSEVRSKSEAKPQ